MSSRTFFERGNLSDLFEARRRAIREEVNSISDEKILLMSPADLAAHLVSKFDLETLALDLDTTHWMRRLEEATATREDRFMETRIRMHGARMIVSMPMSGSSELVDYRPSTSILSPKPQAYSAKEGWLTLEVEVYGLGEDPEANARSINGQVERALDPWKRQLEYMGPDVARWSADLPGFIDTLIERRVAEARRLQGLRGALDIPMTEKAPTPIVPLTPKVIIPRPVAGPGPIRDEPRLTDAVYEAILGRLRIMGRAMEESPATYEGLGEERLRDFFLPILNASFGLEGTTSAETFRRQGSTDILVRFDDGVAFAAECKIWKGAGAIGTAIDQLLGYLTWRDSKAALILFVRGMEFSEVMAKAVEAVGKHGSWKRSAMANTNEGRATLGLPGDRSREVQLAILGFWLPRTSTKRGIRASTRD